MPASSSRRHLTACKSRLMPSAASAAGIGRRLRAFLICVAVVPRLLVQSVGSGMAGLLRAEGCRGTRLAKVHSRPAV